MCLFVVDGTCSGRFNSNKLGLDSMKSEVGSKKENIISNSRKFFMESTLSTSKKFYYAGPGVFGWESNGIFRQVIDDITREIHSGNCTELSFVGWSRGAAIVTEIVETIAQLGNVNAVNRKRNLTSRGFRYTERQLGTVKMIPRVKFLGLFDSVAMTNADKDKYKFDNEWGEYVPSTVDYFAHVIAGKRGIFGDFGRFVPANPKIDAKNSFVITLPSATHGDVGGKSHTPTAGVSYSYLKNIARMAGL